MNGNAVYWQPMASRSNVLVCQPGDPWDPCDLVNMFAAGVWGVDPESGIPFTGGFNVEHWRIEDAGQQSVEEKMITGGAEWRGTDRTLQNFDQADRSEFLPVVVFHMGVDPVSRACQRCETIVGTPV